MAAHSIIGPHEIPFNEGIATSAVQHQNFLHAPNFSATRMTWIKPSFCWMAYRSGFSFKDKNQARILAINLHQEAFNSLIEQAVLSHGQFAEAGACKSKDVVVQWDPERDVELNRMDKRSLQLGMRGEMAQRYASGEFIAQITDVTELFQRVHELVKNGNVEAAIVLCPAERIYEVAKLV
ncbi:hypothetical protein BDR26DRAFT_854439 [Obelidium mucronatum]|nr:hypothetical protein BDR26DRAFT_854439 [Obelidium mucronatum]